MAQLGSFDVVPNVQIRHRLMEIQLVWVNIKSSTRINIITLKALDTSELPHNAVCILLYSYDS